MNTITSFHDWKEGNRDGPMIPNIRKSACYRSTILNGSEGVDGRLTEKHRRWIETFI